MSKHVKQLVLVSLIAMLCFSTAPLWAQDAGPQAGDAAVSDSIELIPLAANTTPVEGTVLDGGFDAVIILAGDCTNKVCTSTIGTQSDACYDCNGCTGIHASDWNTEAGYNTAWGLTNCPGGAGVRATYGEFRCQADSAGVRCTDTGSDPGRTDFCPPF